MPYQIKNYLKNNKTRATFFVLLLFFAWGAGAAYCRAATIDPQKIIELTNQTRQENELQPLKENDKLTLAAKNRAQDMIDNDYFSHSSPQGGIFLDKLEKEKYYYSNAGENLAVNFDNEEETIKAWLKSPGHRQNILSKDYQEIGVGAASGELGGRSTVVVVQLFGNPGDSSSSGEFLVASDLRGKPRVLGLRVHEINARWNIFLNKLIAILFALVALFFLLQYIKKNKL